MLSEPLRPLAGLSLTCSALAWPPACTLSGNGSCLVLLSAGKSTFAGLRFDQARVRGSSGGLCTAGPASVVARGCLFADAAADVVEQQRAAALLPRASLQPYWLHVPKTGSSFFILLLAYACPHFQWSSDLRAQLEEAILVPYFFVSPWHAAGKPAVAPAVC